MVVPKSIDVHDHLTLLIRNTRSMSKANRVIMSNSSSKMHNSIGSTKSRSNKQSHSEYEKLNKNEYFENELFKKTRYYLGQSITNHHTMKSIQNIIKLLINDLNQSKSFFQLWYANNKCDFVGN